MQLMKRIRRIQDALPELRRGAEEVLAAKQVRAPDVTASGYVYICLLSVASCVTSIGRASGRLRACLPPGPLGATQEVVAAMQDTVLSNAEQLASLQRAAGRSTASEAAAAAVMATATALGQWQTRCDTLMT